MRCPICGSYDLTTTNSHAGANNTVRRYKKCQACGAAVKTLETIEAVKTKVNHRRYEKKQGDKQ